MALHIMKIILLQTIKYVPIEITVDDIFDGWKSYKTVKFNVKKKMIGCKKSVLLMFRKRNIDY